MDNLQTFKIYPRIPQSLSFLETLSRNLWWTWDHEARELFRRISPGLWDDSGQNPLQFLTLLPQERLEELADDQSFLAQMDAVGERFEQQVLSANGSNFSNLAENEVIAYFSMEFGLHESIPIFAGGLGILAGDHLKAGSCLDLPLVGVGLLYHKGYFRQFLDDNGWQQEAYPPIDLGQLPLTRVCDQADNELEIEVPGPYGTMRAAIWQMSVGRIPFLLLDTNLKNNPEKIRKITRNLYAGDQQTRLAQEALLGLGGIRALDALGLFPAVCHLNEGHSSFTNLERLLLLKRKLGVDIRSGLEILPRTTLFTTHTPIAAGHDEFPPDLVRPIFEPYREQLGISDQEILSWGQPPGAPPDTPISMFILGSRLAGSCNGVSRLHGQVARGMWSSLWPKKPDDEIPITHVTNGIHIPTWVSAEMAQLFERYLGPEWIVNARNPKQIERIRDISPEELWRVHEMARTRLIAHCRRCMFQQYKRRHAAVDVLYETGAVLKQGVLTIGFARRFASYKRSGLLLQDPERFKALLTNPERPVQFIFAGKAHPMDSEGKKLIQRVVEFARNPALRRKIIFLEDYDMNLGRHLYQGVDVWLNTPRRFLEACGTSGMKAAVNGALNVSILDGWWDEAFQPDLGWAVGQRNEQNSNSAYQDTADAQSLYNVLENEVIPCFYDREENDLPEKWIEMMRKSMRLALNNYSSLRMVREYTKRFYHPLADRMHSLLANKAAEARSLARQRERLTACWPEITVTPPVRESGRYCRVGDRIAFSTTVYLGRLQPEEVAVQLYYGRLKGVDTVASSNVQEMTVLRDLGRGSFVCGCSLDFEMSGYFGYTVRVIPAGDEWMENLPGLITWA